MSPETVAFGPCLGCGKGVAVKLNRSNLAYSRCDHCGLEAKHHWQRTSDAYVRSLAAPAPAAAAPAPAPAAATPPAPAAPAKTTAVRTPAAPPKSSLIL